MIHDYVNRTKPTPARIWWARHHQAVEFALLVLAVAVIGGVV